MPTEKKLNEYGKGRWSAVKEMIVVVENEIAKTKSRNPEPNTPQQIHNGARLKALNNILNKLKAKKEFTENYQPYQK